MAPGTRPWLNVDFCEEILRKSEADNSIRVIDIFSKPATSKGDNYGSDMIRVSVKFTRGDDRSITESKSVIVKSCPYEESRVKDILENSSIFDTEINMMTNTLRKMNAMLEPQHRLCGDCYYVWTEHPKFLVMEDLRNLGFEMNDRLAGLDLEHCMLALRSLARFHASSVALCEQEPEHKKRYVFKSLEPILGNFLISGTKTLADEVATWPELGPEYAEKIRKFAPKSFSKAYEKFPPGENEFAVITHGDFWNNNMLFRYDENRRPIDHIFVDFQLSIYSSPACDLHEFFNMNPAIEVVDDHMESLLQEYLSILSSTMRQLNCKTAPPTMDELKKSIRDRETFGMVASFNFLPMLLTRSDEVKDFNEMMDKNGAYIPCTGYKSSVYRKILTQRIPKYVELGLLD